MAKISKTAYKQLIDTLEWEMEILGTPTESNSIHSVREAEKLLKRAYDRAANTIDALHSAGLIDFERWSTTYGELLDKYAHLAVENTHMMDAILDTIDPI